MKKKICAALAAIFLTVLLSVPAFAESLTAKQNIKYTVVQCYDVDLYVGKDIFNDAAFSAKFWELYGNRFTSGCYFHITYSVYDAIDQIYAKCILFKSTPVFTISQIKDISNTLGDGTVQISRYFSGSTTEEAFGLTRTKGSYSTSLSGNPSYALDDSSSDFHRTGNDINILQYVNNYDLTVSGETTTGTQLTVRQFARTHFTIGPNYQGGGEVPQEPLPGGNRAEILLPKTGFQQSQLNAITMKTYYKIPYDGNMNNIKIKVDGYLDGNRQVQSHKVNVSSDGKTIEGFLDMAGAVRWNQETTLTLRVTDYTGKEYSASTTVTCFDDFVDENEDGLDDRTGQDQWTGSPDFNNPTGGNPSGGFENPLDMFKSFMNFLGDLPAALAKMFSYVPAEIWGVIAFGIGMIVVLRVAGR